MSLFLASSSCAVDHLLAAVERYSASMWRRLCHESGLMEWLLEHDAFLSPQDGRLGQGAGAGAAAVRGDMVRGSPFPPRNGRLSKMGYCYIL